MRDHLLLMVAAAMGLSGGMIVGSALVALLTVLDIIPRLAQLSKTFREIHYYELSVICGAFFWTLVDFFHISFRFHFIIAAGSGLLSGCFVGMLAAGLTEVLNVLPIVSRRLRVAGYIVWILMAMVLGKISGSLFDWLIYQKLN